jgi:hypothetical protein
MWHIQHETFNWCTYMLIFGWWPCLTSSHPLSKRFQQTFSMFSIVMKSNLSEIWICTLGHECVQHWLEFSLRLFMHLH